MIDTPREDDSLAKRSISLDFDGGFCEYRNGAMGMEIPARIAPSGIAPERREKLAEKLNQAGGKVRFVLDGEAASTIHIGKSNAFDAYGRFLGLTEGIGKGNAFVLLDDTASDEQLLAVIRHEAGHILGTLDHGGKGLSRYARQYVSHDYFYAPLLDPETSRRYVARKTTTTYVVHTLSLPDSEAFENLTVQVREPGTYVLYEYMLYGRSYDEDTHQYYWDAPPATNYVEETVTYDIYTSASGVTVGSLSVEGGSISDCIAGGISVTGWEEYDSYTVRDPGVGYHDELTYRFYKGSATGCTASGYLAVYGNASATYCEAGSIEVTGLRGLSSVLRHDGEETLDYKLFNGLVSHCIVNGGMLTVGWGGIADDVTVRAGGAVIGSTSIIGMSDEEQIEILGYAKANNLIVEEGNVEVRHGGELHNAAINGTLRAAAGARLQGVITCTGVNLHDVVPQATITVKLDLHDYAVANAQEWIELDNRGNGTLVYYYANYTTKTLVYENYEVVSVTSGEFDNRDGHFNMTDWEYTFNVDIGSVDAMALPSIVVDFGGTEKDFDSGTLHFAYPSTTTEVQFQLKSNKKKWVEEWDGAVDLEGYSTALMACTLTYNPKIHGETEEVLWLEHGEDENVEYKVPLPPDIMGGATEDLVITRQGTSDEVYPTAKLNGNNLVLKGDDASGGNYTVTAEDKEHQDHECDLELMVVPEQLPIIGKKGTKAYVGLLKKAQKERLTTISAMLPCDPELKFYGMKFKMSDMGATLTVNWTQPSITLKLQGKLEWTFRKDKTLTIDLSGDNYFSVTHSGKETSWDIVGEFTVPDFHIGRFGFKNVYLQVNKGANSFGAGGEVTLPGLSKTIIGDFGIVDGYIDSVGLGVGNLNVPLGATGLMLQSVYGSISGIATSVDMTFGGSLGLSYGPVIDINWDLDWLGIENGKYGLCTLTLDASISTSGDIEGSADVYCLGGFISGSGEVKGSSGGPVSVTGNFSMLKEAISITGVMTSNVGAVTVSGEGRMQVPKTDYFGWLGGTGLSVTVFADLGAPDIPLSQRYILAWEEMSFFGNKFAVGFKCNFEGHVELLGSSDLLGGDEFGSKGPGLVAHSVASPDGNGDMLPLTASETYTVSDYGVTLFQFNFTVSSAWASLSYGGVEFTQGEISSGLYENMHIVDELSNDSRVTIAVNNAELGEWTLNAYGDYGATFGAYALTGVAPSPVIGAVELGDDARSATINYSLADLSALENAVVSIFMDEADSEDYSGMLIGRFAADAATGSYEYALDNEMNGGDYVFYVMVSSDNYAPVFSELSDVLSFRYYDIEAPEQIQQVNAEWRSTGTTLDWEEPYDNIGVAGYKVAYRASDEDEWSEEDTETASFVFADVPNGTYAYRVAAYDAEGNLADWSEEGSVLVNLAANGIIHDTVLEGDVELASYEGAVNIDATAATLTTVANSLVSGSTLGNAEIGGIVENTVIDGKTTLQSGALGYGLAVNETLTVKGEAGQPVSATAEDVTVNAGGLLIVAAGGAVNNVTVNAGGGVMLRDNAEFYDLALDYGSSLTIFSGENYLLTDDLRIAGTLETHHYIDTNGHRLVFEQYKQTGEFQPSNHDLVEDYIPFIHDLDKILGNELEIEIDSNVYGSFRIADGRTDSNGTLMVTDHASGYTAAVGSDTYTVVGNALCFLSDYGLVLHTSRYAIDAPTVTVVNADNARKETFIVTMDIPLGSGDISKCTYRYSLNADMSDAVEVVTETAMASGHYMSFELDKSDFTANATYYVQARTESEFGAVSPWSETASFTVVPKIKLPAPTTVFVQSDDGMVYNASAIGVDASYNDLVTCYCFRYADNPEMTNAMTMRSSGPKAYIFVFDIVQGQDYYIQARTEGKGAWSSWQDEYSEWSDVAVFNTELQLPFQVQTWEASGTGGYIVEYSQNSFETALRVNTDINAMTAYSMPSGGYTWRVRPLEGGDWYVDSFYINAEATPDEPKLVQANTEGVADLILTKAHGIWEGGYHAFHRGTAGGWTGTHEAVELDGMNKLCDIIEGSDDATVLLMTDDANGDALFVDDIYSALPGEINAQQSRLAKIDEIRAGAGDDVVDLTSQRFAYVGDGVTVRGGLGNDVIWANKGDNWLFGDAGDDRIVGASGDDVLVGGAGNDSLHGGGGDDVFAFGGAWGQDSVAQLAGGTVTLWFQEGIEGNWNEETLTYTDGDNSVTVTGVARENITLRFGNENARYGELLAAGAFSEATSERIFEDRGMLA